MLGEAWVYLLAFILNLGNLFFQVSFLMMYSDLESDYITPIDMCTKVNIFILPEAAIQAFLTILFLLGGFWILFLINLPLLAYNARKIYLKSYLLDATEIFRTLRKHRDESVTKVGCHIIFFFIYLYFMIGALSSED